MPRSLRITLGDHVYHALNRANAKVRIFQTAGDYRAFEELLFDAKELVDMRILAYCIMPNHWHLVLYPRKDGDMPQFMKWLTMTHTQRWHAFHETTGFGHLYQGRYKSFPVQTDQYFLQLCRYVEQNPLRAHLTLRAEQWQWSSLWRRLHGTDKQKQLLNEWPVQIPKNYTALVNELPKEEDLEAIRASVERGRPYGDSQWTKEIAERLGIASSPQEPRRPSRGGKP